MAYNPNSAINAIYNLKGQWESANKANDDTKKNDAAKKAQRYYDELRRNGYGSTADELAASNYTQANRINKYYATTGRSQTRPYLYSLGAAKGLSKSDVDKLISYDDVTGEIAFGGKNIGKPDTVVDGVSYWKDTGKLDEAFNDYVNRSGVTRSRENAVNQENESLFKKYNQEYEDLKNTNPFETETGKAILAKYDLAGLQGRDNAVASNAGSNGGNIDSFAAANALRQQSSLISQGQTAALEAYQQKLDHARNLLSDMGVNIDRVFNQDQTAKNNDVARKSEIASVTGYAPDEWVVSNNPYMNDNGTIKDEYKGVDFSAIMAKAKASGNTNLYNAAATARFYKIMGDYGAYGKYDDGNYAVPGAQKTAAAEQFDKTMDYNYALINAENERNTANNKNAIDQITTAAKYGTTSTGKSTGMTLAQATNAIKSGELSDAALSVYNTEHHTSYTKDNPPPIYNENSKKNPSAEPGGSVAPLSEEKVKEWVDYLNNAVPDKYSNGSDKNYVALKEVGKNKYERADVESSFIIIRVLESSDLTNEQKKYLLYDKFGITADEVNATMRDKHYK